ncbi:hypothetical protein ACFFLM_04515 [Deinococcus oregonensis]|uniref:Uncharacterized protein n=1 Tax=Deinococcus oregonensis TaxID=1805970 RepID=A0ABV6AUR2_9DEIO
MAQIETKESKRRKHSPGDIQELQRRAEGWGKLGAPGRSGHPLQADQAYKLSLDFFRLAIGGDFPRWLSLHSGISRATCQRRYKAGIARAAGSKPNRNLSGLLAEQRERETTPLPELNWDQE